MAGETQTPYYVVIVASFLRIYRIGQRGGQDSARLMLFDEALNRMDPERAENALQLMRRFGLQPIVAAPTDKCELLTPHLEITLLVLREGDRAWVEPYHQRETRDPRRRAGRQGPGRRPRSRTAGGRRAGAHPIGAVAGSSRGRRHRGAARQRLIR